MRRLAWGLGLAFFFLNPALACGVGDPEYEYGATEMRAAVEGKWNLVVDSEGQQTSVTVLLQQDTMFPPTTAQAATTRSLVRPAGACGGRNLLKAAGACIDLSQMPLAVTFVDGDPSLMAEKGAGVFTVYSLRFDTGELAFQFGGYNVVSSISRAGVPSVARLGPTGKPGTLTLTRVE
jgi:hypothetical protein